MSHALAFDTLAYAKKLKQAGFTDEQAEIQAEAIATLVDEKLATKMDLKFAENNLRRDIRIVKQLRKQGMEIDDEDLSHISLLLYKHVIPMGSYFLINAHLFEKK